MEQLSYVSFPGRVDHCSVKWLMQLPRMLVRGFDAEELKHMPCLLDLLLHDEIVLVVQVRPALRIARESVSNLRLCECAPSVCT